MSQLRVSGELGRDMRSPAMIGTQIGAWLISVGWKTVPRGSSAARGYRQGGVRHASQLARIHVRPEETD